MYKKEQTANNLQISFPATFANIDLVCSDLNKFSADNNIKCDHFEIEVGLREILTNAVRHGCQNDPAKIVIFTLTFSNHLMTITVVDEGKGFDWQHVSRQPSPLTKTSGRGMSLLESFFDTITFNDTGNKITCEKKI